MWTGSFDSLLALPEQDGRDVFASAARRHDTAPGYVEKDFWACLVLQILFNGLPAGHPKLLFKGGTSLSEAFGLIRRISEDNIPAACRIADDPAGQRFLAANMSDHLAQRRFHVPS